MLSFSLYIHWANIRQIPRGKKNEVPCVIFLDRVQFGMHGQNPPRGCLRWGIGELLASLFYYANERVN